MISLVGYTGFVGSNIYANGEIDSVYNSKNVMDAYGTEPDILIYAGLRAEKYLANSNPEKDMELIMEAEKNISEIRPKKLILISTIDVFKNPIDVDENSFIELKDLHAYGFNRYQLECWVRQHFSDALIIRLPALYGINLKKNFIYDYINLIPFMLKEDKMKELSDIDSEISLYYEYQDNGFYKLKNIKENEKMNLKEKFKKVGFSALNFTDSRNQYQFYPLNRLWKDIQICLSNDIILWHPATEPIAVGELYSFLSGKKFVNEINKKPIMYDYQTIYSKLFGGRGGYICSKQEILQDINQFCKFRLEERNNTI